MSNEHLIFDEITLVCRQCGAKHVHYLDRPLIGAKELIKWMDCHVLKFCACDASTCDVKARIRNPEILHDS
jgi:hypothetical protein